jgi:rod shape-determining protein MreD
MRRTEYLLRPANPFFILLSIILGLIFNLFPTFTQIIWMPDLLSIILLFWISREPYKVGIATAFLFGLIMDVRYGTLFGEKALEYSILGFAAHSMHIRLKHFSFIVQGLHFLPILFIAQGIFFTIHYLQGQTISEVYWLKPLIEVIIWPIVANILLIPQKRSDDIDHTRPI